VGVTETFEEAEETVTGLMRPQPMAPVDQDLLLGPAMIATNLLSLSSSSFTSATLDTEASWTIVHSSGVSNLPSKPTPRASTTLTDSLACSPLFVVPSPKMQHVTVNYTIRRHKRSMSEVNKGSSAVEVSNEANVLVLYTCGTLHPTSKPVLWKKILPEAVLRQVTIR
jgi:hypothetical protein